jgi:hypothetical protein
MVSSMSLLCRPCVICLSVDDTRVWIIDAGTGIVFELLTMMRQGSSNFDRWSQGLKGLLALGLFHE